MLRHGRVCAGCAISVTALVLTAFAGQRGWAQGMIGLQAPNRVTGATFSEQIGIGWGARQGGPGGGWFYNHGGPGPLPPFGGMDPSGQARLGIGGRVGNVNWGLGITAGQGSSQSLSSQTPMITLPNGGMGFFGNSVQTPFVTGIVPVVGGGGVSPVRERWQRLQYERLLDAVDRPQAVDEATDEEIPPPAPTRPPRRQDDPPLILGRPNDTRSSAASE